MRRLGKSGYVLSVLTTSDLDVCLIAAPVGATNNMNKRTVYLRSIALSFAVAFIVTLAAVFVVAWVVQMR